MSTLQEIDHLGDVETAAETYRNSRAAYEQSILDAVDAGYGATAISVAVGDLTEGGVRMLVKRLRARCE